jgi:hypothetical protein
MFKEFAKELAANLFGTRRIRGGPNMPTTEYVVVDGQEKPSYKQIIKNKFAPQNKLKELAPFVKEDMFPSMNKIPMPAEADMVTEPSVLPNKVEKKPFVEMGASINDTKPVNSIYQWQVQDKQPFPQKWDEFVGTSAKKYGHEPAILASLLANESGHVWDPLLEGDSGTTFGLGQINFGDFFGSSGHATAEAYKEALKEPKYSIDEAGRILRYKTDAYGEGDTFWGLVRYNGSGPDAIKYAKDALLRIGRQDLIPEEYR